MDWRSPGACPTCSADSILCAAVAWDGASMACGALVRPDGRKEPLHAYRRDAPGLCSAKYLNTPRPPSAWHPPEPLLPSDPLWQPHRTNASP